LGDEASTRKNLEQKNAGESQKTLEKSSSPLLKKTLWVFEQEGTPHLPIRNSIASRRGKNWGGGGSFERRKGILLIQTTIRPCRGAGKPFGKKTRKKK